MSFWGFRSQAFSQTFRTKLSCKQAEFSSHPFPNSNPPGKDQGNITAHVSGYLSPLDNGKLEELFFRDCDFNCVLLIIVPE